MNKNNLFYIIMGLILLIIPELFSNFVIYAIGAFILIYALINAISYMKNKDLTANLTLAIITGIIGFVVIIVPEKIASIIPLVIGIFIVFVGISKLSEAGFYKGTNFYTYKMVEGLLNLLVGLIICFNPFKTLTLLLRIVGVILIITGCSDTALNIKKPTNKKVVKKIK